MARVLEQVTPDVMLEQRRDENGARYWVAIVAAGSLTTIDQGRAVERARAVLKDDKRLVTHVECVPDEEMIRSKKQRGRNRLRYSVPQ